MSYKMKPAGSRSKFKMSKGARKQMYNSKKKNWQIIDEEIHSLKEKSTEVLFTVYCLLFTVSVGK